MCQHQGSVVLEIAPSVGPFDVVALAAKVPIPPVEGAKGTGAHRSTPRAGRTTALLPALAGVTSEIDFRGVRQLFGEAVCWGRQCAG